MSLIISMFISKMSFIMIMTVSALTQIRTYNISLIAFTILLKTIGFTTGTPFGVFNAGGLTTFFWGLGLSFWLEF